ncbi:MAG: HEPN domain-containing protein [Candidatus Anstonellales archaeon]
MAREFEYCVEKGNIIKREVPLSFIEKELREAEYDLTMAKHSLQNRDVKWATIKAYYSIFHSIRALVFSKGYREKSHFCLMAAFKHLFVEKGLLTELLDYFYYAMNAREGADYGAVYNDKTAMKVINYAESTKNAVSKYFRERKK